MKRMAIVAIAATNQPVYRHYISSYWTELIRHVAANVPHVDVYLLTEHGCTDESFAHISDSVIEDVDADVARLVPQHFQNVTLPGVLSKTIHAFDLLADDYDVFFRTNLSSMVKLSTLDRFVQSSTDIGYSGHLVWGDSLRANLINNGKVGPGRVVADVSELDCYPGNTFISGSGFLLNAGEARSLVERRDQLRFDLPDDVAIGLMFEHHRQLKGFSEVIEPRLSIAEMLDRIESTSAAHVRLQHFPVHRAMALWRYVHRGRLWL